MGYASGFTIWRREDVWTRRKSALNRGTPPSGQPKSYRSLRDGTCFSWLPGTSYLATFIQSLRDHKASVPVHIFEATSLRVAGSEDEDEALGERGAFHDFVRNKNAELLAALERVFDLQNPRASLGVLFANPI